MAFQDSDIAQVVGTIWQSVLGLDCAPSADLPGASPTVMASSIHITGGWQGTIILGCTGAFAARAAESMFGTVDAGAAGAGNPTDMRDAIAELTNMIGGNLKGLLPEAGACQLSLPSVVTGADHTTRVPGSRQVNRVVLECRGGNGPAHTVVVHVLEKLPVTRAA